MHASLPQPAPPTTRRRSARRSPAGFTIVELLAVIFIIALVMGIIFPVIGAMKNGSRVTAGLNTVSMSSDVARQWVKQLQWAPDTAGNAPNGRYSGTAAIFCPTGEVRIVRNNPIALDQNGRYLEEGSSFGYAAGHGVNGYQDRTDIEYIAIPQGSGLAGVYRNDSGVHLIAPPFAIAFNENGHMVQGADAGNGARVIYYDGDFDGEYEIGDVRSNVSGGYSPSDWDGGKGSNNENPHATLLVKALPFDAIETVSGVIVYDESEFKAAGFSFDGGGVIDPGPAYDWLRENGETVFFSPHTGVALRDEGQDN